MKINQSIIRLATLALLFAASSLHAQHEHPPIFAYAQNDGGKTATLNLSAGKKNLPDAKFKTVEKVLNDLIEARGDHRTQAPGLILNNGEKYVAWMNSKKVEIGIEEKAYDICRSFGKDSLNALACLLGHEIVHYYEKHHWTGQFAKENKELDAAHRLGNSKESLKNETQADYIGGFLGYSAGYNTPGIMPRLLEKIYAGYGLPAEIPGYPSLSDRKAIAQKSTEKLADLANVFDMANYLTALGNYASGRKYFKYILKEFQSREIYNNVGVLSVLEALTFFDKKEVKFGYPIELDATSRLKQSERISGFSERKARREELLREAIAHFETAMELDGNYAPAYLNLACAHTLIGDTDEAEYFVRKAEKIAQKIGADKTFNDLLILKGILAEKKGNLTSAGNYFSKAGTPLGRTNKAILEGKPEFTSAVVETSLQLIPEQIEGISLDDFLNELKIDQSLKIDAELMFAVKNLPQSKILVNLVSGGSKYLLIQVTNEDYASASGKGVRLGDAGSKIDSAYGLNANHREMTNGRFSVYEKKNLFFQTNERQQLTRWGVFRVKE